MKSNFKLKEVWDKLKAIGFYTLEDYRAKHVNRNTPLWRCELILTDKCNFNCPYCRGLRPDCKGDMDFDKAIEVLDYWIAEGLKNVRFSGGEPTLYKGLPKLVKHCRDNRVKRIAISTNGSMPQEIYAELINAGANDFSISLDACCASTGDTMAGGIKGVWEKVKDNIEILSKITYVTVGVVLTDDNFNELKDIIEFASDLGVSDIRIISSAQWNNEEKFRKLFDNEEILTKYPILKYRIENFKKGRNVRGISSEDSTTCRLMLDDMVIAKNNHFPCIIAMREGAEPIGSILGKTMEEIRDERGNWVANNNTHCSDICRKNCLDVCVDYNNRAEQYANLD